MVVAGLLLISIFLLFVAIALLVGGLTLRKTHKVVAVILFVFSVAFFSPTVFWTVVICMGIKDRAESAQISIQQVGKLNYYLYEGKERKALELLEEGCDINQKAHSGEMPLHLATQFNLNKVAEKLIALGADINARTNSDDTPLHAVCGSPMQTDCTSESITFFLDHGADINAVNNEGRTPFFLLIKEENYCQKWQTENPYILLQRGADPFIKDNQNKSAVDLLEETIKTCEENNKTQWISYAAAKKLLEKIK